MNKRGRTLGRVLRRPQRAMATSFLKGMEILSGTAANQLSEDVARRVGVLYSGPHVYKDSSHESHVEMSVSVRGKDVFIINTGYYNGESTSDIIMELLVLCYACKTSSARKIIGVIPYLPYSTQCFMKRRGCITAKLLASMLSKAGMSHLVTMDLYHKEIQGFFDFPVDNLRCSPFLLQYIKENVPDYQNGVVVARYPGVTRRATSFAERLRVQLAVIHGNPKPEHEDGRNSPPPFELTPSKSTVIPKEKPLLNVVGDVDGRVAFLVDDIINEVDHLIAAADCLKIKGATKVYAVATHGIMPEGAPELLQASSVDQVIVTNTVCQEDHVKRCPKLKSIDISMMVAEAVRRIYHGESMSFLFKNVPLED